MMPNEYGHGRMDAFTMQIAGVAIQVQPLFQSTRDYCGAYLTDDVPEACVAVAREDLVQEQAILDAEADEEGLKRRKFSDPFLERSVIQRRTADVLLGCRTLMFHGSTVAVDGRAYLFTAACGTGKSTHTRLWRELFGQRAVMVNDDKPFLYLTPEGVLAYGSPWGGKHGLSSNICAPLDGICILRRGTENRIQPLAPADAMAMLWDQAHKPADAALQKQAKALTEALARQVPLWQMECTKEIQAARMAYDAMHI